MNRRLWIVIITVAALVGVVVPYPTDPLGIRCSVAPGADLTADPATYTWTDVTPDLHMPAGMSHTRGAEDEQSETASESVLALKNPRGRYSVDDPLSDLWPGFGENMPIKWEYNTGDGSGWQTDWIQYAGEIVDSFSAGTRHKVETHITCNGLLRRHNQTGKIRSPLFRTIAGVAAGDYVPAAYWPMEDGASAAQFASALGGQPATFSGTVTLADDDELKGSFPLPRLAAGAQIAATIPTYTNTHQWVLQVAMKINAEPASETTYLEVATPGGQNAFWRLHVYPGSPAIVAWDGYDSAGNLTLTGGSKSLLGGVFGPSESDFFGKWWFFTLTTYVDIGQVWGGLNFTDTVFQQTNGGANGLTVDAAATEVKIFAGNGISVGHLGFFTDPAFDPIVDALANGAAMNGWKGEQAHQRIARVCREQRVPYLVTATRSAIMGPQKSGTFPEVLRECEETDHGILDDSKGVVEYRALSQLYNQTPRMTIDAAGRNRLFRPFVPVADDQKRRNKVTAKNPDGTSATVENLSDINGIPGFRRGVGLYEDDVDVNLASEGHLPMHASWFAHRIGAVPGKRFPSITIDFLRAPDLIAAYRTLKLGDRVQIINPPAQASRYAIDVIFTGWSTVCAGRRKPWRLVANCQSYWPYAVGQAGDGSTVSGSWLQTGPATALTAELAPGATSLSVAIDGALFDTTASLTLNPLELLTGGEVLPVLSISGGASPQTFVVTRTLLTKRHPPGAIVQVNNPLVAAL